MQDLQTADRPRLALPRAAPRTLRSTRSTIIIRVARMLRNTDLDIALDMVLDRATRVGIVPDTGVGR